MRYPKTYIVYDLETTGLDTTTAEAIEIGAIKIVKGEIKEKRAWLVRPSSPVTDFISQMTGITNAMLEQDGRPPSECWDEFLQFIHGYTLVGHNISRFDNLIVAHQVGVHVRDVFTKIRPPIIKDWIDTAALYKARLLAEDQLWHESHKDYAERVLSQPVRVPYKLVNAYDDLVPQGREVEAHRALADCEMTHAIYEKLTL